MMNAHDTAPTSRTTAAHGRRYSLAYLTSSTCTAIGAVQLAAELGYVGVGLRLLPNTPGGACQALLDNPAAQREVKAVLRDTGVCVLDLEIIRIGPDFDPAHYAPLLDMGAALGAQAVLVAGDDTDRARLADAYGRLCEAMMPTGMTADLEFMPWTGVPHARAALDVVERAGRPSNAGILIDALHVDRSDTSLEDLRSVPRELLHYAQICDAPGAARVGRPFTTEEMIHTAREARLPPGEGDIDLQALFAALPADLPVSVEVPHAVRLPLVGQRQWAQDMLSAARALQLGAG
ncbi:sugar phosphate isomerase/epimerase [soil metagenome]